MDQRAPARSKAMFKHRKTSTVTTTVKAAIPLILLATLLAILPVVSGCVYRVDVQQGNLLDQKAIDAVQVGMTRSQVRFLLGTPVVDSAFHNDRWDYAYYLRKGRSRTPEQRWLIVWFDGDAVREIHKDVPIGKSG